MRRRRQQGAVELARTEGDDATLGPVEKDAARAPPASTSSSGGCSLNPMDPANCFTDIQAGLVARARLGGDALRMYLRYCERKGYRTSSSRRRRAGGRHQERVGESRGDYAYGYPRPRSASTGSSARVRSIPTRAGTRRSRAFSSIRRSTTQSRSKSIRPTSGSTRSAHRARAGSTSTRPTRPFGSRTCRRTSSSRARPTARSTGTAPRRWRC